MCAPHQQRTVAVGAPAAGLAELAPLLRRRRCRHGRRGRSGGLGIQHIAGHRRATRRCGRLGVVADGAGAGVADCILGFLLPPPLRLLLGLSHSSMAQCSSFA
jgi:hypothetical protein